MLRWQLIVLSASALLGISACNRPEEPMIPKVDGKEQQKSADDAASDAGKARDEFLAKSREEINQLRNRIDALEAKAKTSGAELKAKLDKQVQELRAELGSVEGQWQTVKDAGATAWEKAKDSLSASLEKLRQAVHDATG